VRIEERRVVGADHDVGLVDPVERAAGRHPVHRADQRLPDPVELGGEALARIGAAPRVGPTVDPFLDVDTGAERAFAGRPQDDDVDVVIGLDGVPDRREVVEHGLVEAVHRLRPVQGDRRDVVGHLEQDGLQIHLGTPFGAAAIPGTL
jgi:hypothetical protein